MQLDEINHDPDWDSGMKLGLVLLNDMRAKEIKIYESKKATIYPHIWEHAFNIRKLHKGTF